MGMVFSLVYTRCTWLLLLILFNFTYKKNINYQKTYLSLQLTQASKLSLAGGNLHSREHLSDPKVWVRDINHTLII